MTNYTQMEDCNQEEHQPLRLSIKIVLAPNSMGKAVMIPSGLNELPSNAFNMVANVMSFGEPKYLK
jgi:hypothetical protein